MAGDVNYPSVGLLLHFNGSNGSTTFTDTSPSPKTLAAVGTSPVLSTSVSKFGGASCSFVSAGSLQTATVSSLDIRTSDFTVEGWFYFTSLAASRACWFFGDLTTNTNRIQMTATTAGEVSFFCDAASTTSEVVAAAGTVTTATWYNIACVRSGSTMYLFVDGVLKGTQTLGGAFGTISNLYIGTGRSGGVQRPMEGYVDEFRVTKTARYTSGFSVQTSEFPDWAGQVSGVVRDAFNAVAARTVRLHRRDTGALVGSTTSDAGTGAYTINCPTLDEVDRLVLDSATSGTIYNDLIDRVIPA